MVLFMTHRPNPNSHLLSVLCRFLTLLSVAAAPLWAVAEPAPAAVAAYNSYIGTVESRLTQQHRTQSGFLASLPSDPQTEMRLRRGEFVIEKLTPVDGAALPGAMLHHWRGTAFAPARFQRHRDTVLFHYQLLSGRQLGLRAWIAAKRQTCQYPAAGPMRVHERNS